MEENKNNNKFYTKLNPTETSGKNAETQMGIEKSSQEPKEPKAAKITTTSTAGSNSKVIEVTGLNKTFHLSKIQKVNVLRGIDLKINQGEFVMVFGPSGCGKSTLLNIMIGLEPPTSGEINFLGQDVHNSTEEELQEFRKGNIGIVYQQPNWIKSMNVWQNVAFPLSLKGIPKNVAVNKAYEMLRIVEMEPWANFNPTELSAGQQQRIALARALITDPPVIVADEPTGNLDYQSGIKVNKMLQDFVKSKGKTIIMITHDLENAEFADRVLRMFDGQVIESVELNDKNRKDVMKNLHSNKELAEKNKRDVALFENEKPEVKRVGRFYGFKAIYKSIKNYRFRPVKFVKKIPDRVNTYLDIFRSYTLIILSLLFKVVYQILGMKYIPRIIQNTRYKLLRNYHRLCVAIGGESKNSINHNDLLEISWKNLTAKRSRSLITIGGVTLGIGFTAFLISIGYGLEKLVIDGVARLDQLQQINITAPATENLILNDETLSDFAQISNVDQALPIIGIAGKADYNNSNTDVVIYGVQGDYLVNADMSLVRGDFFEENNMNIAETALIPDFTDENEDDLTDLAVSVDEESGTDIVYVELPEIATRRAIVNEAFLDLVDLNPNQALNQEFDLTMVATEGVQLADDIELETYPSGYRIEGIITGADKPLVYVPIIDVKSIGIQNYTEVRLVTDGEEFVPDTRRVVELDGFRTSSILDTIEQIESVFATARTIFAGVGIIAMAVAFLGVFNTLTVSLLERTREVGLMKAMGMKHKEVRDLFLMESIMMGMLGGIFGMLAGFFLGQAISLIISLIAATGGTFEFLSISFIPLSVVVIILIVSSAVGLFTGLYPAQRATSISALDALRYE